MRKILVIVSPIAVIALAIFTFIFMVSNAPKPQKAIVEEPGIPVTVTEARRETITPHVTTQGEVQARTEIDLVPQISGRIASVSNMFVEGGIFDAGQVLVQIEDEDYKLAVVRAQARVADAEQALQRELAESEMARKDWEELGEGDPTALALRQPQLAQARANLDAAKADLASAELNLRRTRISVPFTGRVRSKLADVGQYVGPGTKLGRVFSTDLVQIRLPLTDRELGILGLPIGYEAPENSHIDVQLSAVVAGRNQHWTGYLARTESAIDPTTRVLYCVVELRDPYGSGASKSGAPLAVGLFVTAEIPGRPIENALVIPRTALRSGNKVMVMMKDDTLDIRIVDVDFTESDRVVLRSGVEPGERVVDGALESPVQGMKLRVIEPDKADTATLRGTTDTTAVTASAQAGDAS